MPEHVWKCKFCSEYNEFFNDANDHEKECVWNPKNKYCYSCSNYSQDPSFWMYGESYTCLKNLSLDDHEEEGNCEGWEAE